LAPRPGLEPGTYGLTVTTVCRELDGDRPETFKNQALGFHS